MTTLEQYLEIASNACEGCTPVFPSTFTPETVLKLIKVAMDAKLILGVPCHGTITQAAWKKLNRSMEELENEPKKTKSNLR